MKIRLGDIFLADLNPSIGSEQKGKRPVLVIQNDIGNKFAPTVVIIPITSKLNKTSLPTHVLLENTKLEKESIALIEQIKTIDKSRLGKKITSISSVDLKNVKEAIKQNLNIRGLNGF